jgi:hypothetical protein
MRAIDADIGVQGLETLENRDPGEYPGNFGAGAIASPATTEAAATLIRWSHDNGVMIVQADHVAPLR